MYKNLTNLFGNFLRSYSRDINRLQKILDIVVTLYIFSDNSGFNKFPIFYYLAIYAITIFSLERLQKSLRGYTLIRILLRVIYVYVILTISTYLINQLFISEFDKSLFKYIFNTSIWFLTYLLCSHFLTRILLRKYRKKGGNTRTILIWGEYDCAFNVLDEIQNSKWLGFKIKAWFSPEIENRKLGDIKCNGNFDSLKNWLNENNIDKVIITSRHRNLMEIFEFFGNTNLNIYYLPSWLEKTMKISLSNIGSIKTISIWESDEFLFSLFIKRLMDIFISSSLIIILSPLFFIIYMMIKLTTKNKCFYKQERYGKGGKSFLIYKFRTMKTSESGSKNYLKQAVKNDERVTRIGMILRKYSLDELPQLVNVLKGEMSLVGPRPHAVSHNEHYRNKINGYMQRHSFKPGMTGLAQIKGFRGETKTIQDMQARVTADLEYIQNWNLLLDLKILVKTFFVIINGSAF